MRHHLSSGALNILSRNTHRLHVPFLTHLSIFYPSTVASSQPRYPRYSSLLFDVESAQAELFRTRNLIPVRLQRRRLWTYLRLKLDDCSAGRDRAELTAILRFLASCPNLRTFSFQIHDLTLLASSPMKAMSPTSQVSKLWNLTSVNCKGASVRSFLNCCPLPEHIVHGPAHLLLRRNYPNPRCASCRFPQFRRPRSSRAVELDIASDHEHRRPVRVQIPFSDLTSVQHLVISMKKAFVTNILPDGPCLPALQSLVFRDCRLLEKDWVALLLGRVKEQGNFPKLEVKDCGWGVLRRRARPRSVSSNSETDDSTGTNGSFEFNLSSDSQGTEEDSGSDDGAVAPAGRHATTAEEMMGLIS